MFQYSVRYQEIIFQFYRHDTCVSKEKEKHGKYSKIAFDIKEEHFSIYPLKNVFGVFEASLPYRSSICIITIELQS